MILTWMQSNLWWLFHFASMTEIVAYHGHKCKLTTRDAYNWRHFLLLCTKTTAMMGSFIVPEFNLIKIVLEDYEIILHLQPRNKKLSSSFNFRPIWGLLFLVNQYPLYLRKLSSYGDYGIARKREFISRVTECISVYLLRGMRTLAYAIDDWGILPSAYNELNNVILWRAGKNTRET